VRADDGAACSLDLECKSLRCVDGACGPCADEACVAERCGSATCGVHGGMQCGTCEEKTYCNFDHCEPACDDQHCGESHGVDCGTCPAKSYCDGFQCQPGCEGFECGSPNGVDCGTCGEGQACRMDLWQCVKALCPVDKSFYCKADVIYSCNGGLNPALYQDCAQSGQFCIEPADSDAQCRAKLCQPNEFFCHDTAYAQCDDEGRDALPGARDCASEDLDCTPLGCGETTDEPVGDCNNLITRRVYGNVYAVTSDVTLLSFSQRITATMPRFLVYEGSTANGTFVQIAESSIEGSYDVSTSTYAPPLNASLRAGHYYILAATQDDDEDGQFCYFGSSEQSLSFGTLLTTSYATASTQAQQVNAPSGPGNTFQHVVTVALK
jgi:hypothetical protein